VGLPFHNNCKYFGCWDSCHKIVPEGRHFQKVCALIQFDHHGLCRYHVLTRIELPSSYTPLHCRHVVCGAISVLEHTCDCFAWVC
jgi:hypothetical protein